MLDSLEIKGFRAFKQYTVDNLGRVNLFVGRNNSGKTTILEAAEILLAVDTSEAVLGSSIRRGEMYVPPDQNGLGRYADVSHLFYDHVCELRQRFEISGTESRQKIWLTCEVDDVSNGRTKARFAEFDLIDSWLDIRHSRDIDERFLHIPLMPSGAVPLDDVRQRRPKTGPDKKPVSFVAAETLDAEKLREFWNAIAATDEESEVRDSLRILEPRIVQVAFVPAGSADRASAKEGIYLRRDGEGRLPLGTFGDGVRHILTLSVAVSRSRKGFVMIDEIDTGLHHSVMTDMWRVLIATAERLDVQIFATTHSLDCVRSLAWLFSQEPDLASVVRLHRVDEEGDKTVVYSPEEILTAAKHHVELRGW
jgi:predicted ATP-dependent endonuclease of OLD family